MRLPSYAWKIVLAIAIATIPRVAAAQGSGTIRGTVTDSASGQPIVGAQITVTGTSLGTITANDGAYVLRDASRVMQLAEVLFVKTDRKSLYSFARLLRH